MDNKTKPTAPVLTDNGIYINGVVISNDATKITKKDGNPLVIVKHELAVEPGVVVLQQFIDPKEVSTVKIDGDRVVDYPKFAMYKPIMVKAEKIEENRGQATVSRWELVG